VMLWQQLFFPLKKLVSQSRQHWRRLFLAQFECIRTAKYTVDRDGCGRMIPAL
jgi:hypothetical protein